MLIIDKLTVQFAENIFFNQNKRSMIILFFFLKFQIPIISNQVIISIMYDHTFRKGRGTASKSTAESQTAKSKNMNKSAYYYNKHRESNSSDFLNQSESNSSDFLNQSESNSSDFFNQSESNSSDFFNQSESSEQSYQNYTSEFTKHQQSSRKNQYKRKKIFQKISYAHNKQGTYYCVERSHQSYQSPKKWSKSKNNRQQTNFMKKKSQLPKKQQGTNKSKLDKKGIVYDRFLSPFEFRIQNRDIRYIEVNSIRLYFQIYLNKDKKKSNASEKQTIKQLFNQYKRVTNKDLILQRKHILIPKQMPLKQIINSQGGIQILERILQILNQQSKKTIQLTLLNFLWQNFQIKRKQYYNNLPLSSGSDLIEIIIIKEQFRQARTCVKASKDKTIISIVEQIKLREIYKYDLYIIYDSENKKIEPKDHNKKISYIQGIKKQITIRLILTKCFLSSNSLIKIKQPKSNIFSTYSLEDIKNNYRQETITLSLEQSTFSIMPQRIDKIGQAQKLFCYYWIKLIGPDQITIQCSQDTFFYSQNGWISIKSLQINTQLFGVPPNMEQHYWKGPNNHIVFYKVVAIQFVYKMERLFYPISVSQTHNLIVNNLILHNQNPITLNYIQIVDNGEFKRTINVYKHEKIMNYFPNHNVYLYGNKLNIDLTFADYKIDSLSQQQCFEIVINIREDYHRINSLPQMLKTFLYRAWFAFTSNGGVSQNRLKQQDKHMYILQNKVLPFSFQLQKRKYSQNQTFLHFNIISLLRLQFLQRVKTYSNHRSQLIQDLSFINNSSSNDMPTQTQYDGNNLSNNHKQVIRAYTSLPNENKLCQQLNSLLRSRYSSQLMNPRKYILFSMADMLIESLSLINTPQVQITCYRGVKQNVQTIFKRVQGQLILLQGFVSTTKVQTGTTVYSGDGTRQPCTKLQIITTTGKDISKYSKRPSQGEILLLPNSYFIRQISKYQHEGFIGLREIPVPSTNKNMIIFWVDRNLQLFNPDIIPQTPYYEVIRTKTQLLKIVIEKFFSIYKILNRKIVIIRHMKSQEDDNDFELFTFIYKIMGFSDNVLLFQTEPHKLERKKQKLRELNIDLPPDNIIHRIDRLLTRINQLKPQQ